MVVPLKPPRLQGLHLQVTEVKTSPLPAPTVIVVDLTFIFGYPVLKTSPLPWDWLF